MKSWLLLMLVMLFVLVSSASAQCPGGFCRTSSVSGPSKQPVRMFRVRGERVKLFSGNFRILPRNR